MADEANLHPEVSGWSTVDRTTELLQPELMNRCLIVTCILCNRSLCNCFMSSRSVLSQCFLEIRMCGQCQSPSRKPSGCPCHPGSEHQSAVLNRTCTWEGTCSAFWWSDQPWEELSLVEYCKHTAHLCLPKDLWVRDLVLPSWVIYKGS